MGGILTIDVRLTKCTNAPIQYCSDGRMGWPSREGRLSLRVAHDKRRDPPVSSQWPSLGGASDDAALICHAPHDFRVRCLGGARSLRATGDRPVLPRCRGSSCLPPACTIAGQATTTSAIGYAAGKVTGADLVAAVPGIDKLATIRRAEQISSIGSQDMNDRVWFDPRAADQRNFRQERGRWRCHHPWHRYDGGDCLLPEQRDFRRQAGGARRLNAPFDGDQRRRAGKSV